MVAKGHPRETQRVDPSISRPSEAEPDRFQGFQTGQEDFAENRLLIIILRARLPRTVGIGVFTSRHPEISIEVLNRSDVSKDVSVSDYWISGEPPGVWAREIATYPDVLKVDCLSEVGDGSLYRITFRNPPIIPVFRKLGIPIHFPLRIQGGFIRWEVVARRSETQTILAHFRKTDSDFQVVSIRRQPLRSHLPLLTETQDELLAQAMAAGYFAVPRGITLTGLARNLGRSKSSLSEMMANIEKKLLESALNSTSLSR
ncbi:MAG TPA: helix-turn-helix domain-containing protein [Thermoplasmata archaeon]|nr:helix-turn-helix domain-containing protein [Thermoplasmata archaeon]